MYLTYLHVQNYQAGDFLQIRSTVYVKSLFYVNRRKNKQSAWGASYTKKVKLNNNQKIYIFMIIIN